MKDSFEPYRSKSLGCLVQLLGFILIIAGFVIFIVIAAAYYSGEGNFFLFVIVEILSISIGLGLLNFGKKLSAQPAREILANDLRKPVLYCRSFSADTVEYDLDENLSIAFKSVGPVIAIGRPGEKFQVPGVARKYIHSKKWKTDVGALIRKAQLIIIYASISDGLLWEFQKALSLKKMNKIVIIPLGNKQDWKIFIEKSNISILPEDTLNADIICFDSDGNYHLIWKSNNEKPWWHDKTIIQKIIFKSSF